MKTIEEFAFVAIGNSQTTSVAARQARSKKTRRRSRYRKLSAGLFFARFTRNWEYRRGEISCA